MLEKYIQSIIDVREYRETDLVVSFSLRFLYGMKLSWCLLLKF